MKIREGFVVRQVAGVSVVISLETKVDDNNSVIQLNDTGLLLWESLVKGADKNTLVEVLLENYEVTEEIARQDVDAFVQRLESAGVFED